MKSRIIDTVSTFSQRLPRRFPRLSQTGLALTGAVCVLTLSGCYYPYGYYPGGYYPYYATVPAGATQQDVQVGPPDSQAAQQAARSRPAQTAEPGSRVKLEAAESASKLLAARASQTTQAQQASQEARRMKASQVQTSAASAPASGSSLSHASPGTA